GSMVWIAWWIRTKIITRGCWNRGAHGPRSPLPRRARRMGGGGGRPRRPRPKRDARPRRRGAARRPRAFAGARHRGIRRQFARGTVSPRRRRDRRARLWRQRRRTARRHRRLAGRHRRRRRGYRPVVLENPRGLAAERRLARVAPAGEALRRGTV